MRRVKITFVVKSRLLFHGFSTLEERAQRLWSTKGLTSLDPSLLAKNKVGKATKEKEQLRHRELACLEAQVYR